jgi:hypothetical protein
LSGLFSQNISCSHDIAKQLLKVTKNTYNNCDFTHMSDSDKLKLLLNTCVKPVARFIIQIFNTGSAIENVSHPPPIVTYILYKSVYRQVFPGITQFQYAKETHHILNVQSLIFLVEKCYSDTWTNNVKSIMYGCSLQDLFNSKTTDGLGGRFIGEVVK